MYDIFGDLRSGVRQLMRRPAFALAAITTLALGVGLNTALFSVVNALLYRGASVAEPDRLVEIYSSASQDIPQFTTSYPDFLAIRDGVPALSGVAAHAFVRGIVTAGDRPALVTGEAVSDGYFEVLGVPIARGRSFTAADNAGAGSAPVVVLSHGMWQRRFAGRPDVLGTALELSGAHYTVIGIAPAEFTGTLPGLVPEFWVPVVHVDRLAISGPTASAGPSSDAPRIERRGLRWLFVKGRLADTRSVTEVRAQIDTVFARLRTEYPATNEKTTASVVPIASVRFHPMLDGYVRAAGAALMVAVGVVLLVACANVASMLLARGSARRKEMALRAAIGAGRGRLLRQLLTESLVLAVVGGVVGTGAAWWAARALSGLTADNLPMSIAFDFSLDARVLAFSAAATTLAALAAGLLPAWSASTPALVPALKDDAVGLGRRRITMRDALVVGQLSLSLMLLVAAALLGRGLLVARSTNVGFDTEQVSMVAFNLQMNGYDAERATALGDRALDALRALPGVTAVSRASRVPLAPDITMEGIRIRGHHAPTDEPTPVDAAIVGADYFTVVGVPLVEGRAFTREEETQGRRVAVVNQAFAARYWPGQPAVGQQIFADGYDSPPLEVVGVARDHKVRSVGETPRPYLHVTPQRSASVSLVVRTAGPAEGMLPTIRQALLALEPGIVFTQETPASEVAATTMAPTMIGALLLGAFGALALTLAAVGLYGVVAYTVSLRTREIGIRMALGAERRQVLWQTLGQGGRLAAAGLALGVLMAMGVARVLESLLYGVSGFDPLAYLTAALTLMLVAALANLMPAVHAARIDPVRALRND